MPTSIARDDLHAAPPGRDAPLLAVSVHERGTLRQTWLGEDPA
jgi:hypothetical protein